MDARGDAVFGGVGAGDGSAFDGAMACGFFGVGAVGGELGVGEFPGMMDYFDPEVTRGKRVDAG